MFLIFCYVKISGRRMLTDQKVVPTFEHAEHIGFDHLRGVFEPTASLRDLETGREWLLKRDGKLPVCDELNTVQVGPNSAFTLL